MIFQAAMDWIKQECYRIVRERNSVFDLIHELAPDGFWFWDMGEPGDVWLSPAFARALGYEGKKLAAICKKWPAILHKEDHDAIKEKIRHAVDGVAFERPMRYRHASGDEVTMSCHGLFVTEGAAGKTWLIAAHRMIVDSQCRLHPCEKLGEVISFIQDTLYTLDTEQRHTGVYGTWLDKLGLKPEDFLGKSAVDLFGEDRARPHVQANEQALKGEHVEYIWSIDVQDTTVHYQTSLSPIYDDEGRVKGLVGVGRDISKRIHAEQTLLESNRRLESFLQISREMTSEIDQEDIMQTIVEKAVSVLKLGSGAIYLQENEDSIYLKAALPELPAAFPVEFRVSGLKDHPYIEKVLTTGRHVFLPDTSKAKLTPAEEGMVKTRNLRSNLYLPIRVMDHTIGFLILSSVGKPYYFTEEEIQLLQGFADQAAHLIERTRNNEHLNKYSRELEQQVNERALIDTELRKLSTAVEQSPSSVIITDTKGIIEYVNPKFSEITGFSSEEAIGQNPRILKSGTQSDAFYRDMWKTINSGKIWRGELHNKKKNGELYWESASISPVLNEDGVITNYLAVKEDTTESHNNLERITSLLETEEKQSESLRNFTHIVSHNLRIHTANMLGVLMLFEMEDPETYRKQFVQMLKGSADNLETTIGHLNEVLDIQLNKELEWKTLDLHEAIARAITDISLAAKKNSVNIINDVPHGAKIRSVPAYLDSIIMSLLSNAVLYCSVDRDSYVRISENRKNGYVTIRFEDNGIGIDMKRQGGKIFKMYKKLNEDSNSIGLGLFITKHQVEAMGGNVEVESEVNRGSVFKVSLPNGKNI